MVAPCGIGARRVDDRAGLGHPLSVAAVGICEGSPGQPAARLAADYVIENDGSLDELLRQADAVFDALAAVHA